MVWPVERGDEAMGGLRSVVVRLWIQVLGPGHILPNREFGNWLSFYLMLFCHQGLDLFSLPGGLGCWPIWTDLHWGQTKQSHRQQLGAELSGLQNAPVLLCGCQLPPEWTSGSLAENGSAKHHS